MNRRDFTKVFACTPLVLLIPVGVRGESKDYVSAITFRISPPRASESDPFAEPGAAAWKARGDDGEMYGNLITLTDFDSAEIIAGEIAGHFRSQISSIPALSHLEELSKEMIRDKILERLSV